MTDEQEEIARAVQKTFRSHPVLLIGSGFSCAYGLPGMGELGLHLLKSMELRLVDEALQLWQQAAPAIKVNLEEGLGTISSGAPGRQEVIATLREETARLLIRRTLDAETEILSRSSPSSEAPVRLLKRLYSGAPQNSGCVDVITTNYDTLVELFCDLGQLPVDTGFIGFRRRYPRTGALFEKNYSRIIAPRPKGGAVYEHRVCPTVRLLKPHGSITWHSDESGPVEVLNIDSESTRSIVVPGPSKYEDALTNRLFDNIRTEMNAAIQRASAVVAIGFGFNDAHLQGVLTERLRGGMPMLILTREFTQNLVEVMTLHPDVLGIQKSGAGAECVFNGKTVSFDQPLWELDAFLRHMLE